MRYRGFVFDAYGTLFDVHSVVLGSGVPGDLHALSLLWRQKQIEYTWLSALMERYEDFWQITEAALRSAIRQLKIEATEVHLERLMQRYLAPAAFPDARSALESLSKATVAILSNGTPEMLRSAINHNGFQSLVTRVISVDRIRTYKPSPRVYALAPEVLNLPAREILFVSSNFWDVAGAKAFGYPVCWCNRKSVDEELLGIAPDRVISRLDEIPAICD